MLKLTENQKETLQKLREYYCKNFAEDPQDGSVFDGAVLACLSQGLVEYNIASTEKSVKENIQKTVVDKPVRLTTDPTNPRLGHGVDNTPVPQQEVYLVLSEEERAKGFVRPYRDRYIHKTCGVETIMGKALSETYAREPKFYSATYCAYCQMHKPVSEFTWGADGKVVGS